MDLYSLLFNINWIAVLVLTIFSFVIGFAWHQPFLFGKAWKKANNPNNLPQEINGPLIFGGTAFLHFLAIAGLSALISGSGGVTGLIAGCLIALVFILPAMGGTYLFANRSLKLLAIDSGMYLVLFAISGLVLGIL